MKDLAKGLAALGRNGDSTLVHMHPGEVAGLQALAKSQGTSLTINPHTGLPEAFNLMNAFTSLLPTAVGFMLGGPAGASMGLTQGTGWATMAPIVGGALTGAALASAKGEDPLMGGLTGGFGGYGGAGLAGKVSGLGATAASQPGPVAATPNALADQIRAPLPTAPVSDTAFRTVTDQGITNFYGGASEAANQITPQQTFNAGLQQVAENPMDFIKQNPLEVGMPVGGALLAGLEPSDIYGKPLKGDEDKYDPYATLNLSGSTGLKLYADGGSIQSGGLRDLYGTSDNANIGAISEDGYGLGRLNQMANQTDMTKAQNYMYAKGGSVDKEPTLNLNTANRDPETSRFGMGLSPLAMAAFGRGMDSNRFGIPPMALAANPFLARLMGSRAPMGSPVTGLNLESGQQETRYIAKGGYLDGMGDGMSDSIPATIEGRQPARLADGEFVVPADVVSHIGNGSSKAGAKRLYSMLDRVREARTGTKKQGKEINPKKYMPA